MSDRGQPTPPPAAPTPDPDPSTAGSPSASAAEPAPVAPIEIQEAPFSLLGDDAPEESTDSEAAPPGSRRKRTRTIVLASLLAVGLAGVGALGAFYWQISSQRDTTLNLPAQIGELTLDTGANAQETADYLQTALSAEVDLDKTVGAVYTATAGKNVLFFGGTTLFWSPDKDLDTSFDLISDEQGAVTGLHEVDAGALGGTMKCGTTKTENGDLSVCGWADHGSLALAMFPDRPESEAAPLMRQMREAIQTRN
ncbi:hypothetical protein GCM10010168_85170 [Actinoplanes ianthinogenes]|uniref:Uncharacterized protein n=1 Tax=Actinoplanes ianthinogenes TaxID=122358 RepID=A0ABM7M022_9ACTN|nr:hypothetical protein [Actinoplanes ianthinogenes]BCJ44909.1 hypothetical protein Aiant_55660 [Actinoplanes ianthinogenes]GGR53100.1 hypothetical protein GCM10010168_85170 [Actinoplanes ianthinogenes]